MKPIDITVSEALASPKLFAPFFAGPSWDTWKAIVKAMYAEPMNTSRARAFPFRCRARSANQARWWRW